MEAKVVLDWTHLMSVNCFESGQSWGLNTALCKNSPVQWGKLLCYRYPEYEFVGDSEFSRTAGLSSRYTDSSLLGIILDIHFLSKSNYLVCTFSSQVYISTHINHIIMLSFIMLFFELFYIFIII